MVGGASHIVRDGDAYATAQGDAKEAAPDALKKPTAAKRLPQRMQLRSEDDEMQALVDRMPRAPGGEVYMMDEEVAVNSTEHQRGPLDAVTSLHAAEVVGTELLVCEAQSAASGGCSAATRWNTRGTARMASLTIGEAVRVVGLRVRAELNGQWGVVVSAAYGDQRRFGVRLCGHDNALAVRADRLEAYTIAAAGHGAGLGDFGWITRDSSHGQPVQEARKTRKMGQVSATAPPWATEFDVLSEASSTGGHSANSWGDTAANLDERVARAAASCQHQQERVVGEDGKNS